MGRGKCVQPGADDAEVALQGSRYFYDRNPQRLAEYRLINGDLDLERQGPRYLCDHQAHRRSAGCLRLGICLDSCSISLVAAPLIMPYPIGRILDVPSGVT